MNALFDVVADAKLYDLAQPYFVGMPHHPSHPPFLYSLVKQHGEYVGATGNSSAADAIALGTHVGTHIDALSHFSCGGVLHGGVDAAGAQSYTGGMKNHSIDSVPPIVKRAVMLDIAGMMGNSPLAEDFVILPEEMEEARRRQGVTIHAGDIVLLRTGWAAYFEDPKKFICEVNGPGPAIAGAQWLSGQGLFAVGSDTVAFEKVPDATMPVHVHLLVEKGIHIIECLNLEQLAAERVYEFLFVALPLKIRGATGSPVRPVALAAGAAQSAR
jgi:kynurenine formamidase